MCLLFIYVAPAAIDFLRLPNCLSSKRFSISRANSFNKFLLLEGKLDIECRLSLAKLKNVLGCFSWAWVALRTQSLINLFEQLQQLH